MFATTVSIATNPPGLHSVDAKIIRPFVLRYAKKEQHTKWTDEDDRRLLELRAAGKSERVIALALRRSPGSVGTRLDLGAVGGMTIKIFSEVAIEVDALS